VRTAGARSAEAPGSGGGGAALVRVRRKENSSGMRSKFKASLNEFRPRIFGIPPLDENEIMDSGLIF
jgi:hypothetical protein